MEYNVHNCVYSSIESPKKKNLFCSLQTARLKVITYDGLLFGFWRAVKQAGVTLDAGLLTQGMKCKPVIAFKKNNTYPIFEDIGFRSQSSSALQTEREGHVL